MKKLFIILMAMGLSTSVFAQNFFEQQLNRFTDPEKGKVVFFEKGNQAFGIAGSYRNFNAAGLGDGDGYSIFSLLNIGNGQLQMWNVAPSFSYFVADDVSLGVRLDYSGYMVDTNLKLDFRDILGFLAPDPEDPDAAEYDDSALNLQISSRHMYHHKGGLSFTARKYMSFFGSKTIGIFGEARLQGSYGTTTSYPLKVGTPKIRYSRGLGLGLKFAAGAIIRLRDISAITVSVPLFGVVWNNTVQEKQWKSGDNQASMSSLRIARNVDYMGIQIGYVRYVQSKKKK